MATSGSAPLYFDRQKAQPHGAAYSTRRNKGAILHVAGNGTKNKNGCPRLVRRAQDCVGWKGAGMLVVIMIEKNREYLSQDL